MKKWCIGILSFLLVMMLLTGCVKQQKETIKPKRVDEAITGEVIEEHSVGEAQPAEEKNIKEQNKMTEKNKKDGKLDEKIAGNVEVQESELLKDREEKGQDEKTDGSQKVVHTDDEHNFAQTMKKYYYSPFSGSPIKNMVLQRAVMASIENSPQARPQSGLETAPIVYEFLVEGGITRFLALYWNQLPDKIGPIRSVRPYIIDLALEYNALLLHAGASTEGFAMLEEGKVTNLDQIYKGNYYWRVNDRKMPHNLYTGDFKIKSYLNRLTGQEYSARFLFQQASFLNPEDEKAEKIIIDYWGDYRVCYKYDPVQNEYRRYLYDFESPHLTADGVQLTAKNIIIQYVSTRVEDDEGRLKMDIYGQGDALIFRDGIIVKGFWKKEDDNWTQFFNEAGKRVAINPGQTWIQLVPELANVHYEEDGGYNE